MEEFRAALGQYLVGAIEVADLENVVDEVLAGSDEASPQLAAMLDELYASGRLPHQIYAVLKRRIALGQASADQAPSTDATRLQGPAGQPGTGEATSFVPPVGAPSAPSGPGEDATRISGPGGASPPDDATQVSLPSQRGQTGQPSQSAASRSSNWSHPSQWTGGGDGPSAPLDLGAVIKGRFVLESVLGQGGMGKVFKARDLRKEEAQDRKPFVAIKILNEDFKRHPQALQALQRESRKAQDLAHPNIVTVFDFDRDGDNVFMTMEYLDGESLDRFNKRHSPGGVPVDRALELIEGLSKGLMHAHSHGVVHSDFKPANAFLTRSGDVKIFDFGIARAAQAHADAEGEKTLFDAGDLGALTPAYASCEMLEGGEPDPRDDVYALAVVAYELMAGRHPFDKKPAVKARAAGLQPAPIRGLSRRQWRALARGLAFGREQRSPSVDVFLEGISPRALKRGQLAAVLVAAAAVVGSVVVLLPGYLDQRHVDSLIGTINAGPDVAITARLEELRALPTEQFRNVFVQDTVQTGFLEYYQRRIRELWDPARKLYRYEQASVLLRELGQFFPDSRSVGELEEQITGERDNQIADLYQDLDRLREQGLLISEQGEENVVDVLAAIRQIDSADPRLRDGAVPIRFAEVGGELLEGGDIGLASRVVDQGLALAAGDVSLVNLRDRIQNRREQLERARRIAELESVIGERLSGSRYAEELEMLTASIRELAALEPANQALARARDRVHDLVADDLDALIEARNYAAGQDLLERFAGAASAEFLVSQQQTLDQGAAAYRSRVEGLLERLDEAIASDRLEAGDDAAVTLLAEMAGAGVSDVQLIEARARTAEAYAARGLRLRTAGRWDDARGALSAGLQLEPPGTVQQRLQEDLALVDQYQQLAERAASTERQALMAQARQQEVQRLQDSFDARLSAATFGVADARGALADLRALEEYDAAPGNGRARVAELLQTQIAALSGDEQWQSAIQLAEQSQQLLPERAEFAPLRQRIQADYDARVANRQAQQIAELQGSLDALVASARLDQSWDEEVRGLLQRYGDAVGAQHPDVTGLRERVAGLLVNDARRLRIEERYENAVQALERAASYAPGLASLAQEQAALASDRRDLQRQLAARARDADVERLRNNLRAEAARGNAAGATEILDELRNKAPDDAFVRAEGPRIIATSYADLARKELDDGRLERARSLVTLGRQHVPDLPQLTDVESAIAQAADQAVADTRQSTADADRETVAGIGRALASDQPLNTDAIASALEKIRRRNPDLIAQMEPGMVRTMLVKLDELGSSNRGAAARRLESARAIFPRSAELMGYSLPQAARPLAATDPCANPGLVGNGVNRRAVCRDELGADRQGPPLVVIPGGGPFSRPVAISKYEITISDYNLYCELSSACAPRAGDRTLPVTGISASEAEAFVAWLGQVSGARYRLPNGREWEYAADAAGQQPPRNFNCEVRQNNVPIKGISLVPVNTGDANGWGLKNYVGNAQEWVKGGSGWEVRGGAHTTSMSQCDVHMESSHTGEPDAVTGFRVLREIG